MDTFKDKQRFDEMEARGDTPWQVWKTRLARCFGCVSTRLDRPIERVLCLGAHCDDLEIGCGGTVMKLAAMRHALDVTWVVFSGSDARAARPGRARPSLLRGVEHQEVVIKQFRDGFFPSRIGEIKDELRGSSSARSSPDLILTHWRRGPAPGPPARSPSSPGTRSATT